ncbi:unnamed protein product [Rotaria sp. Silwood2]|nr:unnamed protein product [Rotaria sp. Silwood2]CAF2933330.1 unnamed protein product [Rotaria sp. Silwood2]CAF4223409.1 unnamed protein product [Rotaria sp. Silwood2]
MNFTVNKINENIISLTQSDSDSDGSKWVESKKLIARKIFCQDLSKLIAVVSKIDLTDILSDQVSSFCDSIKCNADLSITSLKFNNIEYFVRLMENVPEEIIDDLVDSQEFIWGNLWLFHINKTESNLNDNLINEIKCVISKCTFKTMPNINSELLASTSDGCELLWFNPSSNTNLIN